MRKTAFKKFGRIWSASVDFSNILKAVFHKIYLVRSWILCLIYITPINAYYCQRIESVQDNANLDVTGVLKNVPKFYQLELDKLCIGKWLRHLLYYYKLHKNIAPAYTHVLIPQPIYAIFRYIVFSSANAWLLKTNTGEEKVRHCLT